jgi:hypothetical protein
MAHVEPPGVGALTIALNFTKLFSSIKKAASPKTGGFCLSYPNRLTPALN